MTPTLPAWVQKRDGRREPFDADKISQSLYAATEAAGSPHAFLARELADGVLHFLVRDHPSETTTTSEIAELIEKVVRELGHPALAQAYGRRISSIAAAPVAPAPREEGIYRFSNADPPETVVAGSLRAFSLQALFNRDIAAAHDEGLLVLGGLETPEQLDSIVVDAPPAAQGESPWHLGSGQVAAGRWRAGRYLIVDSPEWLFAVYGPGWLESFLSHLEAFDRFAIFNVNVGIAPAWAAAATGPLFAPVEEGGQPPLAKTAAFWTLLKQRPWNRLRIDWHVRPGDAPPFVGLEKLMCKERTLSWLTFVCDGPREPIMLSEATNRTQPAVLMEVALPLPSFLAKPEIQGDVRKFLEKLPSLVRMAASAGVQKRNYLRRAQPDLARAFLLERARLVLAPLGLDETVQRLTGAVPAQSKLALAAARQILITLRDSAQRESRTSHLDMVVASPSRHRTDQSTCLTLGDLQGQMNAALALQEIVTGAWVDLTLADEGADLLLLFAKLRDQPLQRFRIHLPNHSGN